MRIHGYAVFYLVLLTLSVAGCGVKPGSLSPPPGEDKDRFPATYPNPAEDSEDGKFKPDPY